MNQITVTKLSDLKKLINSLTDVDIGERVFVTAKLGCNTIKFSMTKMVEIKR